MQDTGLIPGLGRSPGGRNSNPPQYSRLGNPWAEEPGGLQPAGWQGVGHDRSDWHAHARPVWGMLSALHMLAYLIASVNQWDSCYYQPQVGGSKSAVQRLRILSEQRSTVLAVQVLRPHGRKSLLSVSQGEIWKGVRTVRETESLGRGQNATVPQGRDEGCAIAD